MERLSRSLGTDVWNAADGTARLAQEMFQKKHRRVYIRAVSTLSAKEAL